MKFPDSPWLPHGFEKFPDPLRNSLTFPTLLIRLELPWGSLHLIWASSHYTDGRLTARFRKYSKRRDSGLDFPNRFTIWQAPRCLSNLRVIQSLTQWGRVTYIYVSKLTIIGSENGLSPGRRQAIIWTNAGILLIGPLGTNFIEILIGIQTFSFKKMYLKMSSAKWRQFCLGLNVLNTQSHVFETSRTLEVRRSYA